MKGDSSPESQITRLRDLRLKLLPLHKSLLELERVNFEKKFGRVNSGELLQLVINHAQFAWLGVISALVVEIDEMLNGDQPATLSDMESLFAQARLLLTSQPTKNSIKSTRLCCNRSLPS